MIPISADPKRFCASLSPSSVLRRLRSPFFKAIAMKSCFIPMSSGFKTQKFDIMSKVAFSTSPHSLNVPHSHVSTQNERNPFVIKVDNSVDFNWFTGKAPVEGLCPGVEKDGILYSLPQLNLKGLTKQKLQDYFDNTWTLTEVLMSSIKEEKDFMRPPDHGLRHPMIFYYGHPAALYINKLRVAGLVEKSLNPYFEVLFETGVDEMSWDDMSKNEMVWPSVSEVKAYRRQVYQAVSQLISQASDEEIVNIDAKSPYWALVMSFDHERIHLETSSVLLSEMPLSCLNPHLDHFPRMHFSSIPQEEVKNPQIGVDYPFNEMIPVEGQKVSLGKPNDIHTFSWDNEYGQRDFVINNFKASKFNVSNGEYLEFVKDGGYQRPEFWSEAGWGWRTYRNAKWPHFWIPSGPHGLRQFKLRTMFEVTNMPWSWPVVVNFHEAAAFAKWKNAQHQKSNPKSTIRLVTELEHYAMNTHPQDVGHSEARVDDMVLQCPRGRMYSERHGEANSNLMHGSPVPVDHLKPNSRGFYSTFGNVWEWCLDYFCALPGFQVHPLYEDFSTPCFDGLHNVIKGGSFLSTGNEASVFSRFHFRPHFLQYAGIRLVEQDVEYPLLTSDTDAPGPYVGSSYPFRRSISGKQHEDLLKKTSHFNSLLLQNFTTQSLSQLFTSSPQFNKPLPTYIIEMATKLLSSKASLSDAIVVEVGCGAGKNSLELSHHVRRILGFDHNNDLITTAKALSKANTSTNAKDLTATSLTDSSSTIVTTYTLKGEGELTSVHDLTLEYASSSSANTDADTDASVKKMNVEFRCADPMCLPAEIHSADIVILNDVIDKIASPNALLGRMSGVRGLVNPGGLLFVSSCFQWNESTTPKSLWLGGYLHPQTKEEVSSADGLKERLSPSFELMEVVEMPLVWMESKREIHGRIMNLTVWKRK